MGKWTEADCLPKPQINETEPSDVIERNLIKDDLIYSLSIFIHE